MSRRKQRRKQRRKRRRKASIRTIRREHAQLMESQRELWTAIYDLRARLQRLETQRPPTENS